MYDTPKPAAVSVTGSLELTLPAVRSFIAKGRFKVSLITAVRGVKLFALAVPDQTTILTV